MAVFAMPKKTDGEKAARAAALEAATLYATRVPLKTMKKAYEVFDLVENMAVDGNPASVTDAGVGALAARAAVRGAGLNVRINAAGLKDRGAAESLVGEAAELERLAEEEHKAILSIFSSKM